MEIAYSGDAFQIHIGDRSEMGGKRKMKKR